MTLRGRAPALEALGVTDSLGPVAAAGACACESGLPARYGSVTRSAAPPGAGVQISGSSSSTPSPAGRRPSSRCAQAESHDLRLLHQGQACRHAAAARAAQFLAAIVGRQEGFEPTTIAVYAGSPPRAARRRPEARARFIEALAGRDEEPITSAPRSRRPPCQLEPRRRAGVNR